MAMIDFANVYFYKPRTFGRPPAQLMLCVGEAHDKRSCSHDRDRPKKGRTPRYRNK